MVPSKLQIMRHKRLVLGTVLLLCLGLAGLQAQRIYIEGHESPVKAYFISDIQKMSFSPDEILVHKVGGGSDAYPIADVRNLHFNLPTSVLQETLPATTGGTFLAYPNPAIDVLNIQLTKPLESAGKIELISLEGKLVHTRVLNSHAVLYRIDVSGLAKGLYLCRLNSGRVNEIIKIIIQ